MLLDHALQFLVCGISVIVVLHVVQSREAAVRGESVALIARIVEDSGGIDGEHVRFAVL